MEKKMIKTYKQVPLKLCTWPKLNSAIACDYGSALKIVKTKPLPKFQQPNHKTT
jgi:hypothetical protein